MNRQQSVRNEALKRSQYWWLCDNIVSHAGQCGLLHMNFPRLFILMRDYGTAYWATYEHWKTNLIEVTFLESADKETTSPQQLEELLIDAWNFLALEEEAEDNACESIDDDDF